MLYSIILLTQSFEKELKGTWSLLVQMWQEHNFTRKIKYDLREKQFRDQNGQPKMTTQAKLGVEQLEK